MERDSLLATNRSIAEESLARRPRLQNGKLQLAAKYKELEKLTASYREKQSRLGEYPCLVCLVCCDAKDLSSQK